DLNGVVKEFFESPEMENIRVNHPQVQFETDLFEDLLRIRASKTHITKSLLNLVLNGAEAVRGEGTVRVATENRYVDKPLRGYDAV
ncbi:hypothetical protein NL529_30695, partial [Klebsiella pneumoniae]|nr:hypothetical protein [Klebsiella pneumoniae]